MKYYVRAKLFLIKVEADRAEDFPGYPYYINLEAKSKKDAKEKGRLELLKKFSEGYFLITDVDIFTGFNFID